MRQDEPNTPVEHAHLMRSGAFDNFWVLERVLGSEAGFVAAKKNSKNDLCGRRPLRDQNLEVCRFADGYRLAGTQIIAIDSKPNIKMRTGMVADRTARNGLKSTFCRIFGTRANELSKAPYFRGFTTCIHGVEVMLLWAVHRLLPTGYPC